jgi:hypothetical protein
MLTRSTEVGDRCIRMVPFIGSCCTSLGQGDVRQVSVNGQRDVILLAVRPSGRRPENKLRPSL